MKFKIDENMPLEVAELLRNAGHDSATVTEQISPELLIPVLQLSAGKKCVS
jgi:predicted nuclease of predicted toxin-antitoxin system